MEREISSQERSELLHIIKAALLKKQAALPLCLSAQSYALWETRKSYQLIKGFSTTWETKAASLSEAVVVKKSHCLDSNSQYLLFETGEQYNAYQNASAILGASVLCLFAARINARFSSLTAKYGIPKDSYAEDKARADVEATIGLYFTCESIDAITDEHLHHLLGKYLGRMLAQKVSSVFSKYAAETVYLDADSDMDCFTEDEIAPITLLPDRYEEPDTAVLKTAIIRFICASEKTPSGNSRGNLKPLLFSKIAPCYEATRTFITQYYADLYARRSAWRPVAFAWQVVYAHLNGIVYLSNPAFIATCADNRLDDMLETESTYILPSGATYLPALENMRSCRNQLIREQLLTCTLSECAADTTQIGKALSKEFILVQEQSLSAIVEAITVVAEEQAKCSQPEKEVSKPCQSI